MQFKKFRLVPEERLEAPHQFQDLTDLLRRAIKLTLLLCRVQAFNENFEIKGRNGEYLKNTNIVEFLLDALSKAEPPAGRKDFLQLLYEAKVDPEIIVNADLRNQLESLYREAEKAPAPINPPAVTPVPSEPLESTDDFVGYHTVFTKPKSERKRGRRRRRKKKSRKPDRWIKM